MNLTTRQREAIKRSPDMARAILRQKAGEERREAVRAAEVKPAMPQLRFLSKRRELQR